MTVTENPTNATKEEHPLKDFPNFHNVHIRLWEAIYAYAEYLRDKGHSRILPEYKNENLKAVTWKMVDLIFAERQLQYLIYDIIAAQEKYKREPLHSKQKYTELQGLKKVFGKDLLSKWKAEVEEYNEEQGFTRKKEKQTSLLNKEKAVENVDCQKKVITIVSVIDLDNNMI